MWNRLQLNIHISTILCKSKHQLLVSAVEMEHVSINILWPAFGLTKIEKLGQCFIPILFLFSAGVIA